MEIGLDLIGCPVGVTSLPFSFPHSIRLLYVYCSLVRWWWFFDKKKLSCPSLPIQSWFFKDFIIWLGIYLPIFFYFLFFFEIIMWPKIYSPWCWVNHALIVFCAQIKSCSMITRWIENHVKSVGDGYDGVMMASAPKPRLTGKTIDLQLVISRIFCTYFYEKLKNTPTQECFFFPIS